MDPCQSFNCIWSYIQIYTCETNKWTGSWCQTDAADLILFVHQLHPWQWNASIENKKKRRNWRWCVRQASLKPKPSQTFNMNMRHSFCLDFPSFVYFVFFSFSVAVFEMRVNCFEMSPLIEIWAWTNSIFSRVYANLWCSIVWHFKVFIGRLQNRLLPEPLK